MLEVLGAKSPPGGLPGQTPPAPAAARDSVSPPLARSSLRQKREKTESQAPFQAVARARCPQWELVPLNPNDPPGQLLGQERVPWVDWQGCMEALGSGVRQFNPRRHVRRTGPGSHCGGQGVPRCPGESAGCLPGRGDLLSRQAQSAGACGTVSQSLRPSLSQRPPKGPALPMDCASPDPGLPLPAHPVTHRDTEMTAATWLFLQPPLCTQRPASTSRTGRPGLGPPLACPAPPRAPAQGF